MKDRINAGFVFCGFIDRIHGFSQRRKVHAVAAVGAASVFPFVSYLGADPVAVSLVPVPEILHPGVLFLGRVGNPLFRKGLYQRVIRKSHIGGHVIVFVHILPAVGTVLDSGKSVIDPVMKSAAGNRSRYELLLRGNIPVIPEKIIPEQPDSRKGQGRADPDMDRMSQELPEVKMIDDLHNAVGDQQAQKETEGRPRQAGINTPEKDAHKDRHRHNDENLNGSFRYGKGHGPPGCLRRPEPVQEKPQDRHQYRRQKPRGHPSRKTSQPCRRYGRDQSHSPLYCRDRRDQGQPHPVAHKGNIIAEGRAVYGDPLQHVRPSVIDRHKEQGHQDINRQH